MISRLVFKNLPTNTDISAASNFYHAHHCSIQAPHKSQLTSVILGGENILIILSQIWIDQSSERTRPTFHTERRGTVPRQHSLIQGGKWELQGSAPSQQCVRSTRHSKAALGAGGKASSTRIWSPNYILVSSLKYFCSTRCNA